jgi:hypothetical protein
MLAWWAILASWAVLAARGPQADGGAGALRWARSTMLSCRLVSSPTHTRPVGSARTTVLLATNARWPIQTSPNSSTSGLTKL